MFEYLGWGDIHFPWYIQILTFVMYSLPRTWASQANFLSGNEEM
jgi:hypothetical protein